MAEIKLGTRPSVIAKLVELGGEPLIQTPEQFGKDIVAETEKWKKVVEAAKLRALITKTRAFDPVAEDRKAQIEDAQRELALQQSIRDAKIAAAVEVANQNDPTGQVAAAETVRIMGDRKSVV